MRLRAIKLSLIVCFVVIGMCFPQQAHAYAPDVVGRVVSFYTGAPVAGIWVKWTDMPFAGGRRYAQTDSNGYYFFDSVTTLDTNGQVPSQLATYIDTNLDGVNDDQLMYQDPNNGSYTWDFTCTSDPHLFTGVVPVGMAGTFSTVGPVNINNGQGVLTLEDIIFTPDVPPTPTPVPVYTVTGNVFVDTNTNGVKDAGEENYSGTPVVSASRGTVVTSPGGLYTISDVTEGPLTVSAGIPSGFSITMPRNGPPPTFQIIVGPGCSTNGAPGAGCEY